MDEQKVEIAILGVKKCMLLCNFYLSLWPMVSMSEEDELNSSSFFWEDLRGRC